ncbi:A/G-specific adenine glycosylase [Rubrobacter marinus]|uniref:A/G-specific adenine glycosylase n=1 Tax=Rubrobacter marinus TaxID=2653852 RepID=A0A6G8PYB0_9ACTN|nr:A/G-specific adenine glycosylase [Rubrobacter marinus]QIN79234.1 A/G-specific adenine glycosylase [Rubrobacter marinus]
MSEKKPENGTAAGDRLEAVRGALISWFVEHGRDLPWRYTRDPYHVLVSEVMLQQIQVTRAVPFYLAFLERFPTVEALAGAPIAEAIRVWGDLGRYRRVVNLHRTARLVVEEHGGEIPPDPEVLATFPGIGPYTAGAVACFAFERDVPFVDTNMRRVLHRLFFGPEVPDARAKDREILSVAAELVPRGRGWEWNQALMELGALRCTARRPLCDECPVADGCRARGDILEALSASPRAAKKPVYRYKGSNRYYRGRALAKLREAPEEGVTLRDLGAALRDGFTEADLPWVEGVARSLEKDGLAVLDGAKPAPGTPDIVAEERPAYGAEASTGAGETAAVRVRLP